MSENQQYQTPAFHDGEPANLEAAALDALEWMEWTEKILRLNYQGQRKNVTIYRLGRAIKALKAFLPADEPVFTETPRPPTFGAVAEIVYSGEAAQS